MAKKGGGGGARDAVAPPQPVVEELPRAIVRRVVKDALSQLSSSTTTSSRKKDKATEGGQEEISVQKEALFAFSESARIFIHYLSATANDVCRESKRQNINAEDVLKALEEIEFPEFMEPLRVSLEEFRRQNAVKKSGAKAKEKDKKRKMGEEELPTQNGEGGDAEGAEEENNEDEGDAPEDNE